MSRKEIQIHNLKLPLMEVVTAMKYLFLSLLLLLISANTHAEGGPSALEEKILAHDRKGAHAELEHIMRQDRDEFYRLVDAYDSILSLFEAYDKLENADDAAELQFINEFKMKLKNTPPQIPFSEKVVDAIKEITANANRRIEARNERIRETAEQRRKEKAERELTEAGKQEAMKKNIEEQRLKAEEEKRKQQEELAEQVARQEAEQQQYEKLERAREAACGAPEYFKQSIICHVCGSIQAKRLLKDGMKRYNSYEQKFGVVDNAARKEAIGMDISYDAQIAEGKKEYKQKFKKSFPISACEAFNAQACESKLEGIEKKLVEKYLASDKLR